MKTEFENTWIVGKAILNNWDTFILYFWNEIQNSAGISSLIKYFELDKI